jgi:short-subunit dehydrogenase
MNSYTGRTINEKGVEGKVVVITGASSGAGRAAALAFANNGARLVLAARREAALAEAIKECEELGATAMYVVTDVTDAAAMKHLAKVAVDFGGHIDVWVNNAGVLAAGAFDKTPVEVHEQVIRTNLLGYINGAHAVIPYFKQQGYGVLINNISVGGWFPTPYAVGYSASKFGLRGYSEALRGELLPWPDIHICDLFPAFLDTPGIQHAANYTGHYIKPAPPVYDPMRVANAMVTMSVQPQPSLTIGSMSTFLRVAHALAPGISRRITAGMIESYLKKALPTDSTPGNVLQPVEYGSSIYGGWNSPADAEKRKKASTMILAGIAVGWLLLRSFRS